MLSAISGSRSCPCLMLLLMMMMNVFDAANCHYNMRWRLLMSFATSLLPCNFPACKAGPGNTPAGGSSKDCTHPSPHSLHHMCTPTLTQASFCRAALMCNQPTTLAAARCGDCAWRRAACHKRAALHPPQGKNGPGNTAVGGSSTHCQTVSTNILPHPSPLTPFTASHTT
jgi:hypothetical protein